MLSFLKNHPFAVEAFFESSVVLTFATAKEQLLPLIPQCLELDTFKDKYAFVAIAIVQTKALRPKGFPKTMGNDFFLIGYRVFVRYTNSAGKRLRGLYIIKSETDKKKMAFLGNLFTHYNYTTTDIHKTVSNTVTEITSNASDFRIVFDDREGAVPLPGGSPFCDWKEARKFAGPLPFTFTFDTDKNEILIIEGVRENWAPKPINIMEYNISFLQSLNLNRAVLANAFIINNIPYWWKKGRLEQWKK